MIYCILPVYIYKHFYLVANPANPKWVISLVFEWINPTHPTCGNPRTGHMLATIPAPWSIWNDAFQEFNKSDQTCCCDYSDQTCCCDYENHCLGVAQCFTQLNLMAVRRQLVGVWSGRVTGNATPWLNQPVASSGSSTWQELAVNLWYTQATWWRCHMTSSSAHISSWRRKMVSLCSRLTTDSRVAWHCSSVNGLGSRLYFSWSQVIQLKRRPMAVSRPTRPVKWSVTGRPTWVRSSFPTSLKSEWPTRPCFVFLPPVALGSIPNGTPKSPSGGAGPRLMDVAAALPRQWQIMGEGEAVSAPPPVGKGNAGTGKVPASVTQSSVLTSVSTGNLKGSGPDSLASVLWGLAHGTS